MARGMVLGMAVILALATPGLSWAQAAPTPAAPPTTATTPTTPATTTTTPVGVVTVPNLAAPVLSAPVNANVSPSAKFSPVTVDPNALAPSCALEEALDACGVQW